jgi:hypothetical protein
MKKLLSLFAFLSILTSCSKENKQVIGNSIVSPNNLMEYITSKITENPDATLNVISAPMGKDLVKPYVSMTASLDPNLDDGKAIKEVSLANIKLPRLIDSMNNKVYFSKRTDEFNPFGQKVAIVFSTSYFDFQTNFSFPELVKLNLNVDEAMSKSKGYTMHWNKDNNNELPVQISLQYSEVASKFLNPNGTFPKDDIQVTKFVKDEGEYRLSSEEIEKFPSGCVIRVSISRGSFSYQKSNGKNILLYALSSDTNPFLKVVD